MRNLVAPVSRLCQQLVEWGVANTHPPKPPGENKQIPPHPLLSPEHPSATSQPHKELNEEEKRLARKIASQGIPQKHTCIVPLFFFLLTNVNQVRLVTARRSEHLATKKSGKKKWELETCILLNACMFDPQINHAQAVKPCKMIIGRE